MDITSEVTGHYSRSGLEAAIVEALQAEGKDPDHLAPADLSGADEFHFGWRPATLALGKSLGLTPDLAVLDVGSGIGGPARHFAETYGCRVTGVDLSADYVETANSLTRRCGLADRVSFRQGNAATLPFGDGEFDVATMIHVGMNVPEKARLFKEVRRVLKDGGRFCVYDIMRIGDGEIAFPEPWAVTRRTSFVETPQAYRDHLADSGFKVESEQDRREMTLTIAAAMREKAAAGGAPPLGLHVLMGPAHRDRIANAISALQRGVISPIQMTARAI